LRIELGKDFAQKLKGRFGKYEFTVGVIDDGPHRNPKRGVAGLGGQEIINEYAGGPVRQKTRKSERTISQVSKSFRENAGVNIYTHPFKSKSKSQAAILKFTTEFFKLAFGRSQPRRAETLLQAIVRNPILRGDYGNNSELTQKIKGFDRFGIDTAQLFKAIKAKVKIRGGR